MREASADSTLFSVLDSVAINFVTTEDVKMLREIEQFYNTEISEMVSRLVIPHCRLDSGETMFANRFSVLFAQPLNVADLI